MIHALQSGSLHVEINDQGAELHSLFSKTTKTEYLWQGEPSIWAKRAPVLFPIVGRLKDSKYSYNGVTYQMPNHGFASANAFIVEESSHNSLALSMEDTQATRAMYPFAFNFKVIFTLNDNSLEIIYLVANKTGESMYFSFGSHEAYRCPRNKEEAFEDYYLEFDRDADYSSHTVSPNGLLTKTVYPVIEGGRMLPLNYGLFDNDSLVFVDITSKKVALCSNKSSARVEIEYSDAPNLVIWTKKNAPYVCIEPWHGLPDFEDSDGQLVNKHGIISLEKGGIYSRKHTIGIYD